MNEFIKWVLTRRWIHDKDPEHMGKEAANHFSSGKSRIVERCVPSDLAPIPTLLLQNMTQVSAKPFIIRWFILFNR